MKTFIAVLKTLIGLSANNAEALQVLEREFSLGRRTSRSADIYKF